MKRIAPLLFLMPWIAVLALAQSYQAATVVKWETKPYSQSAHITRDQVVYTIQLGSNTYEIARRNDKVEMTKAQQIHCRIEGTHLFLRIATGKETKYDIIGMH